MNLGPLPPPPEKEKEEKEEEKEEKEKKEEVGGERLRMRVGTRGSHHS